MRRGGGIIHAQVYQVCAIKRTMLSNLSVCDRELPHNHVCNRIRNVGSSRRSPRPVAAGCRLYRHVPLQDTARVLVVRCVRWRYRVDSALPLPFFFRSEDELPRSACT